MTATKGAVAGSKRKRRRRRKKLSPDEKQRRRTAHRFKVTINTAFKKAGFEQIRTRDQQINFLGRDGEIDAIFLYENIVVLSEDTCDKDVNDHLRKKAEFFKYALDNRKKFISFLFDTYPELKRRITKKYHPDDVQVRIIYCSYYQVDDSYRNRYPHLKVLSLTDIRYFRALSATLCKTARFELFKLLKVPRDQIGARAGRGAPSNTYGGFVLPEKLTGFPQDIKLVTFYIDPLTLMETAYVLRKDSWEDQESLYQRMLIKSKLKDMREYLSEKKRVYINNIIVALSPDVKIADRKTGNILGFQDLSDSAPINVVLPLEYNTVGIIDGQHRVFSYYEGEDKFERKIALLREKQELLITGAIFPRVMSDAARYKFEAQLFLEINDKQSRAKGGLKQAIETIVSPFTSIALAKSVISRMSRSSPLGGLLDEHYFGDGIIKTTSVVSYALRHIVVIPNDVQKTTLFYHWDNKKKEKMKHGRDMTLRDEYVAFCTSELNKFIGAFKAVMDKRGMWDRDKKKSRVLTTTTINGLIFCFRNFLAAKKPKTFYWYRSRFEELKIDFSPSKFPYKSSHWKALGEEIYKQCF